MNELGPEATDLLDAAREADLPGEADRRRVRNALLAKIAAGTVVGASATAASSSAAAAGTVAAGSGSAMLAVKIIAAVALVGGGVAVPVVVLRTEPARAPHVAASAPGPREARRVEAAPVRPASPAVTPVGGSNAPPIANAPPIDVPTEAAPTVAPVTAPIAPAVAPVTAPIAPTATTISAPAVLASPVRMPMATREPRLDVAQSRGSRASRQTQVAQTSTHPDRVQPEAARTAPSPLAREAAILQSALASIRDGRPEDAVAELDRHADGHPDGVLAQERVAARIRALCAMGRTGDADEARAAFLRRWPGSPLAARVRAGCAR